MVYQDRTASRYNSISTNRAVALEESSLSRSWWSMADKASRSRAAQLASGGILFSMPFSTTRPLTAGPLNPLRRERVEGKNGEGAKDGKPLSSGDREIEGMVGLEAASWELSPKTDVCAVFSTKRASHRPLSAALSPFLPFCLSLVSSGIVSGGSGVFRRSHQETATMMIISI